MIKFLVRWLFRFLMLGLVLVVALILLKDVLAKALAEYEIHAQSGMDVKIGKLELGLLSPALSLEDLTIFNRPEFGGSPFLSVPDLHVEYDLRALARRQLHLTFVRVSLAEVQVVEAKDGRTNVVLALEDFVPPQNSAARPVLGVTFGSIDTLNLTVGKIKYTSLRRPDAATEVTVGLNNAVFTHVRSVAELTRVVLNSMVQNGITVTQPPREHRREPASSKLKRQK